MKRFTFSLQKLLDYKQQMLALQQSVLLEMRGVLQDMENKLQTLLQEQMARSLQFNRDVAKGMTVPEIRRQKSYLQILSENISQKQIQIQFQKLAVEKQTDKVRSAKIELSTIEKLREKKYEEYRYQENKAQELFIEEFVSHARATEQEVG